MNRIKGFTPVSTVDWPGKVVSVIYIGGCNFRCGYCHNPELALNTAAPFPADEIFHSLEWFQKEAPGWIDGIVITGGEPTSWNRLGAFCRDLQRFNLPIRIDTNGSDMRVPIPKLQTGGLISGIMVDIKTLPSRYEEITGGLWLTEPEVEYMIDMINHAPPPPFFIETRTTAIPGLVEEPEIREIQKLVKKPHTVQFFRPGRCLDPKFNEIPPFTPEREAAMRKEFNS